MLRFKLDAGRMYFVSLFLDTVRRDRVLHCSHYKQGSRSYTGTRFRSRQYLGTFVSAAAACCNANATLEILLLRLTVDNSENDWWTPSTRTDRSSIIVTCAGGFMVGFAAAVRVGEMVMVDTTEPCRSNTRAR